MKAIYTIVILSLIYSISFAQLNSIEVDCWTEIQNEKHIVSLKLNAEREIIYWDDNQIAKADDFGPLAEDTEEWGFEYINSFRAKNGYSIIQAGTTADEIKVGISRDLTSGFYEYIDLGSGNGNSTLSLTCEKK